MGLYSGNMTPYLCSDIGALFYGNSFRVLPASFLFCGIVCLYVGMKLSVIIFQQTEEVIFSVFLLL